MKKLNLFPINTIVLLLIFLSLAACKKENIEINEPVNVSLTQADKNLIASSNNFAFNLFSELKHSESSETNIFISPFSISMALGMTLNGAESETHQDMRRTLGFENLTQEEINASYRKLIDLLPVIDPKVKTRIANSIWYRNTFDVLKEFIETNEKYFDAEVNALDFTDPAAKDIINAWVSNSTEHKITEIINEINAEHVMFLINAIYFKADWTKAFDKEKTTNALFKMTDGSMKNVEMMYSDDIKFGYQKNEKLQVIDLPYGNGKYSLTILLPHNHAEASQIAKEMTSEEFYTLFESAEETEAYHLYLPKFELEYEIELRDALSNLGMGTAFSTMADFSGIHSTAPLMISEVKHKTYVKMDEEGTEAAAVTSVGIINTSMPPTVMVNSPFIYVIHERHTGALLFMGFMNDPS